MLTFVLVALAIALLGASSPPGRSGAASGRGVRFVLATVVALGIPAQAMIGGITVLTDLNPWIVALHLLVSMAIIGVCVVLRRRRCAVPTATGRAGPGSRGWPGWCFAAAWVVLYLGTVVTGSGPHSGDLDARRTGLDPQVMSHVHAIAVYLLRRAHPRAASSSAHRAGAADGRPRGRPAPARRRAGAGRCVGFTQYFLDLPEALVVLHMLGAALVSAAHVDLRSCSSGARRGAARPLSR